MCTLAINKYINKNIKHQSWLQITTDSKTRIFKYFHKQQRSRTMRMLVIPPCPRGSNGLLLIKKAHSRELPSLITARRPEPKIAAVLCEVGDVKLNIYHLEYRRFVERIAIQVIDTRRMRH